MPRTRQGRAAMVVDLTLNNERDMEHRARQLGVMVQKGDVVALSGDFGTGKTTFARAFIRSKRHADEDVPSPTFTLVQPYPALVDGDPTIYHFDLYRLEHPDEALELGIEDAFADGISLIEWPERLGSWLPERALRITLSFGASESMRKARVQAPQAWWPRLQECGGCA